MHYSICPIANATAAAVLAAALAALNSTSQMQADRAELARVRSAPLTLLLPVSDFHPPPVKPPIKP
jgi:hypothetical protein